MRRPQIKTPLPGPLAKALINKDHRLLSPSLPREYPLVISHGEGVWVDDPDGNCFLDFTSGIAVCNTGHCHPQVVSAAKDQLDRLIHTCGADFYHQPMIDLAEKLAAITPGDGPKRVYLGNSGAEAVESGFKLARWHSRRQGAIAFLGAFHGRTMGALTLTASKSVQKRRFSPLIPGVTHVPYAHCYRCAYNLTYPSCDLACVQYIEDELFKSILSPEEIAVIVVEPIQGEGGYIVPPPDYHTRLKALAEKYGILYMVDEIQSGMGRTGKLFAIEHFNVVPDMLTSAKGLASGMPLSALVTRDTLMNWERGAHGSTYGGNPVSCAASLASIALVESGLTENAADRGSQLRKGLDSMLQEFECIGDIRGMGLMQAIELVKDRNRKTPDKALRDKLLLRCFENGLLLLSCGESTIRFCPPLIITEREVDLGLEIFHTVLKEISG
ncbi:MAG: aspartate aminotransferase family protein [Desulfobacteraceae bacterium 4572_123]|nr:MAG: aspartate aminotransferase family protein [Desulfobacteraceae bacterium 4572_123]